MESGVPAMLAGGREQDGERREEWVSGQEADGPEGVSGSQSDAVLLAGWLSRAEKAHLAIAT